MPPILIQGGRPEPQQVATSASLVNSSLHLTPPSSCNIHKTYKIPFQLALHIAFRSCLREILFLTLFKIVLRSESRLQLPAKPSVSHTGICAGPARKGTLEHRLGI